MREQISKLQSESRGANIKSFVWDKIKVRLLGTIAQSYEKGLEATLQEVSNELQDIKDEFIEE